MNLQIAPVLSFSYTHTSGDNKIYLGGLCYGQFKIYSIQSPSTLLSLLCSGTPPSGMSRFMFGFEMSGTLTNAFFNCGYFINYCIANNGGFSIKQFLDENFCQKYHTDTRALSYYLNSNTSQEYLFVGNDGGVTRGTKASYQDLFTFSNIDGRGLYITQFYGVGSCAENPVYFAGGSQDNQVVYYNYPDQSYSWGIGPYTCDVFNVLINPDYSNNHYKQAYYLTEDISNTYPSIRKTNDGFQLLSNDHVVTVANISNNDADERFNKPLVIDPNDPDKVYVGFHNIYNSTYFLDNFGAVTFNKNDHPDLNIAPTSTICNCCFKK